MMLQPSIVVEVLADDLSREWSEFLKNRELIEIAHGPSRLATRGLRVRTAQWLSRTVLRAEPCPDTGHLALPRNSREVTP
jgi:hypothetical protein